MCAARSKGFTTCLMGVRFFRGRLLPDVAGTPTTPEMGRKKSWRPANPPRKAVEGIFWQKKMGHPPPKTVEAVVEGKKKPTPRVYICLTPHMRPVILKWTILTKIVGF